MKPPLIATTTVQYVLPVFTVFMTASNLTRDHIECRVALGLSFLVLALVIAREIHRFHKQQNESWQIELEDKTIVVAICALIIFGFSLYHLLDNTVQEKRLALWNDILTSRVEEEDSVEKLAEMGDGAAIAEMMDRCKADNDFVRCRYYAQKLADRCAPDGYSMLITLYMRGLGGPVDMHAAINNRIALDKIILADYDEFRAQLNSMGYVPTEWEERAMENAHSQSKKVIDLVNYCVSRSEDSAIIATEILKHRDELTEFSDAGNITATTYLYLAENQVHPEGSPELSSYVSRLYDVNFIPTGDPAREVFMRHLGKDVSVSLEHYRELRKMSLYPLSHWDETHIEEMRSMPDSTLLSTYVYLRDQYRYYKRLFQKPAARINLMQMENYTYDISHMRAEELLAICIEEIKRRTQ